MVVPVVLLALAGCSGADTAAGAGTPSTDRHLGGNRLDSSHLPVETPSAGEGSVAVEPRIPPELPDAKKTFVEGVGKHGSRSFPVISRIPPGTLEVAVVCTGSGSVDVNVGSFVGYTVTCADGGPGELDEVGLSDSRRDVVVSVVSRTSGVWGISVGWSKDAESAEKVETAGAGEAGEKVG
jgi:hypothetical protein